MDKNTAKEGLTTRTEVPPYLLFIFPTRQQIICKTKVSLSLTDPSNPDAIKLELIDPMWLMYQMMPQGMQVSFDPVLMAAEVFTGANSVDVSATAIFEQAMIQTVPNADLIGGYEKALAQLEKARIAARSGIQIAQPGNVPRTGTHVNPSVTGGRR